MSVTFQKRDPGAGELAVQLVDEGGEVLKEQNTTAEFGVVSLTLAPNERQ